MRIVICLKQVPMPGDVRVNEAGELHYLTGNTMMNLFDAHALEGGLRLKDDVGATVVVLGFGGEKVVESLRQAVAMGADQAVHVTGSGCESIDSNYTALVLAAAIQRLGGADLVLVGRESTVANSGQVGPMLAEFLEIPHVSAVRKIWVENERVRMERDLEGAVETLDAAVPVLCTVSREIGEPRLASVKGVIRAKKTAISTFSISDLGLEPFRAGEARIRIIKLEAAPPRPRGVLLQGNLKEQIDQLVKLLDANIAMKRGSCCGR